MKKGKGRKGGKGGKKKAPKKSATTTRSKPRKSSGHRGKKKGGAKKRAAARSQAMAPAQHHHHHHGGGGKKKGGKKKHHGGGAQRRNPAFLGPRAKRVVMAVVGGFVVAGAAAGLAIATQKWPAPNKWVAVAIEGVAGVIVGGSLAYFGMPAAGAVASATFGAGAIATSFAPTMTTTDKSRLGGGTAGALGSGNVQGVIPDLQGLVDVFK